MKTKYHIDKIGFRNIEIIDNPADEMFDNVTRFDFNLLRNNKPYQFEVFTKYDEYSEQTKRKLIMDYSTLFSFDNLPISIFDDLGNEELITLVAELTMISVAHFRAATAYATLKTEFSILKDINTLSDFVEIIRKNFKDGATLFLE